ncbi:hypothetical protein AMATHDRAFT_154956 [Amanita thiersii Skay4041]|uniref:HSF-type DNA-binding domain-containing protein n=1 Tax=Amanita thiersii Skay4041 TaxID=703135 RepID=A0A2A9NAW7_9AGAR|nr:hypothetical protein AMATHDRAFT_154956 [Amanita thiersii Skay4041]
MDHTKDLSQPSSSAPSEDPMPSTSDFVKKLYKMLEDQSFQHVVSWGPQGDCFVVKDMNEFTKSILPRMFKHSNFASFVRQLNKYDFHKVKNTDDNQFGEHSWTFRHPDFHANRKDALENIKRKVPAARKSHPPPSASTTTRPLSPPHYSPSSGPGVGGVSPSSHHHHQYHHHPYPPPSCIQTHAHVESLQSEVRRLREEGEDMRSRLRTLERNYENVLLEMVNFQRGMAQQDGLLQNLICYFVGSSESSGEYYSSSSNSNMHNTRSAGLPTLSSSSAAGGGVAMLSAAANVSGSSLAEHILAAATTAVSAGNGSGGGSGGADSSMGYSSSTPGLHALSALGAMGGRAGALSSHLSRTMPSSAPVGTTSFSFA